MSNPSINVSWSELACKDGMAYPDAYRLDRLPKLMKAFEIIRSACGDKSIQILSAYRTPEHNKEIGGAKNSQHVQGRALDLRPPNGYDVNSFYLLIKSLAIPEIKGIGKYPTFVHIDVRPTDKIAYWFGSGVKDDRTA